MSVRRPAKAYVFNNGKLNPASVYSRPALPPWYQGVNGFGQARATANQQFEYTLKQMAASPFSVNSKAYMQRIRDEYGYDDNGTYDVMGTVGGVVGAGVGAMYGSGLLRPSLTNLKFWKKSSWQNPWTGKFNPKRSSIHDAFRGGTKYETALIYNKAVDNYADAVRKLEAASDYAEVQKRFDDAKSVWDSKKYARTGSEVKENARKAYNAASEALEQSKDGVKVAANNVADARKAMDKTLDAAKAVDKTLDTAKAGNKIATKVSGIVPWVGLGFDVAGLGVSIAGLQQSIEQGDTLNTILNSVAVVADTAAVVGDVLEFTPLAPAGFVISMVAGVVSIGVSAIQGWLAGQTIGHSLSPEGMKAQQLFAENLYASMIQRPVTTAASLTVMYGLPLVTGRIAAANLSKANIIGKAAIRASRFLSENALGNQVRAGVSMMALQGVSSITGPIDDKVPWAPKNPEDMNFVSAISLYGDINDNLYGATRVKSIMLGLVKNDSKAMVDAMSRSWGYSDDIYHQITFDDIRQGAGVELGPLGNSIVSTLGELLVDPQNYNEVIIKYSEDSAINAGVKLVDKTLDFESAKALMTDDIAAENTIGKLVDKHGLLSARVINKADRKRYLKRIIGAYLKGDAEALGTEITNMSTHRARNARGNVEVTFGDPKTQADIMVKFLDDIFKGEFRYVVGSQKEKETLKRTLLEYESIMDSIKNKQPLTDKQKGLQKNAERTFRYLLSLYGDESTPTLVNKFIGDLDLNLDNQNLNAIYTTYTDLRHHMDNIDIFSQKLNTVVNPVTGIVKNVSFIVGKAYEYIRSKYTSAEQKSVTILKQAELQKNLNNIVTTKEIDEAFKRDEESRNYDSKGVLELINKQVDSNEELQKRMNDQVEKDTVKAKEEHAKQQNEIQEALDGLNAYEKSMEESKQDYLYQPKSYSYSKKRKAVYVDPNTLPELEKEIARFETESGKKLSKEEIDAKIANTRKTASTQRYLDVRDSLLDYKYNMKYFDNIKDVIIRAKSAIKVMDTLTLKLNNDLLSIINLIGMFRVYANSLETTTDASGKTNTTQKFDLEAWKRLEEELDNPDSDMTKLMLEYGLLPTYTVTKADGSKETFRGLKAIRIKHSKNIPLSFELKEHLNYSITKIIHNAILSTDLNSMIDGAVKLPDTFTKENWKKLGNDKEAKFKLIIDFVRSLSLSEKDLSKVLDEDVLLHIYKEMNKVLSKTGPSTVSFSIDELTENNLRAIVVSKIYDRQNKADKAAVKTLNKILDMFKNINTDIENITKNLKEDEDAGDIELIIHAQLHKLNYTLGNNTAFKFIKAAFRTSYTSADNGLGLFMNNDASVDLLPPYVSSKDLDDVKNNATDYVEKRIIRNYVNSPIVQEIKERQTKDFEYMKAKHNQTATQTEVDMKAETAEKYKQRRNKNNRRKSDIRGKVKKEASKRISNFVDLTYNDISNLRIGSDLETDALFKTPYMRNMNRKRGIALLIARILKGNVKDLHLEYITYKLGASKFAAGSDSDFKDLKSYFYLLKKYNRSSSAHKELLNVIAERIVTMIEGNKDLGIDTAKLVNLQKKHASETDRELLIRRIVSTYYKEGTIEIKAKMTNTKQATTLFSKAVYKAALNFMYNHTDIMPYQLNNKDAYEDADIEHFINRLKDEKDNSLNVARQEIFKEASSIFHDSLYSGTFSNVHNRLTDIADSLIETEQKEIRNISERYYSVATDVAKRLIFGDPSLNTLLEDIIKFNEKDDKTEFGTGLFQVLHLLNEYISEDYKYKKALKVSDITHVEIDKNDRVVFTLKDSNETLTLFTLMFKYHLNIEAITKIMERATVNRALGGTSAQSNVELSARVRSEYNDLLNKYGGILTHNTLDIDEVAFKAQGGTDKELEIVRNVDLEILYNNMRLLDVLETNRTKNPNGKPRKTKYNRMEDYYKQQIKNIYERAISAYNNKNILNIYGVDKEKINEETAVLLHILKSKLDDKIKKNLIRNVFFDQYRVVSSIANQEHIDALQLNVDNLKKQLDKASESSKASIEKKIKGIEKRIKDYVFRNSNIENVEYRHGEEKAFDKFYAHIRNNLEDAASYYNNRIDSDSGEFVLARTLDRNNKHTNKFVLVKHYETDGTSNVEDISKGIPNYNMHIGENIIAKNDPNKVKDISKRVEDVFETTAYKDKDVKVAAASNTGVVITVSKDADLSIFKDNRNNYLKELKLGTGVDVFVIYDYQYKEITSMEASGEYDVVYDYVVKMDNKGNIKGYRPNIINVKSSQTKVESYLSDLALLPKQDVDKTIKALMNYAKIYNKYVIVNKSYVKNVAFNKSETYKALLNYAKINQAYNEFLKMLDPKGTGSFYAFNLETIANLFFRNEFIKQQSDGTYFNVSNLKYKVKKIDVLNQLQNTKVNGESLLSLIQKSIVHLQKNFGTSDINFDMRNVMSNDFETTLRTLTNQTYKILTDLRTTHNTIYNKILPRLNKKLEKNFITDYTAEEITERRRYTKTLDKDIRLKDGGYNPALLNPYGTPVQRGIRNRALKKLKESLKIKNDYGDTNETIIANESRRQREVHKARVKSINDSRSGYSRSTIRYNALLNLYNDYEENNTLVKNEPGIHKPTKYKDFKFSKKSELKKYTDGLYEIVQDIKKQIKKEKDPQVKKELQERIARFLPKQNDNDPNGTSFALTTREDFYDYTVSLLINEYILNVTDELVPRNYWDIVMDAIGRSGMDPDKFGPIFDKLWKEREAKRSARTYTKLDKYRKVGNGSVDIEDDVFNYLFVRDEFEFEIKELFTDVVNEIEEFLFTNKTPVTPVELPKDVEYTNFKEYIEAQPVEQQEFYKFALKYFPTIRRFRALKLKEAVQKEGFMYNSEGEIVNKQGVVMDLEDHFFKHALNIKRNRKKTNKGFTGTKEVYRLLGTPILDNDTAFKDYFIKKYLFKDGVSENIINNFLREFGITNVQQRNILINYKNLNEILEGLSGDMTIEEMYAFTMVVNMVKEQFLKEHYSKYDRILYHQTDKTFDEFDIDSFGAGALDHRTPRGVFLKPTDAKLKDVSGDKQYRVGVNVKKTLEVETAEDLEVFLTTNSAESKKLRDKKLVLEKQLDDYDNFKTQEDYEKAEEEYYEVARRLRILYNNVLKNLGYDSVHIKKDVSTDGEVTETWIILDTNNTSIIKNKNDGRFSWKQAHKEFVIEPIHKGIDALETIEYTKTFKRSAYETNIIDSVFESTNFIFESLRYVKDTNRLLGAIVVKPNEKINEVYDVNPVYVTTKESNAFSITREVGRNITEVLFQPNTTISPIGEQKIAYNRALGDAVSDFMAERNAEDINSVGPNKTYNTIRELFTNPFKLVMKSFKKKDFIRVAEVASAVDVMINNTDNVRFYEKEFNKYMKMKLKGDVTKIDEVEKSIAEISEYFTASGYLRPMDDTYVKAVVGYILQSKYNELEVDRSEFIKRIIDFTTSQEKFKNVYKQKQLESIAYKLTPSRNPEELSEIIFGKGVNELTEEERRNFTSILDLQNFISTGTKLNPLRLYDTYDYVYESTRDIYNDESTATIIQYRAEEEIKNIENKIRGLKGARTRIGNKHSFNTDHEAVLALEATEKLVSKLLNEKEVSKLKYNNALIAKDAEKNRILNELVLNNPALIAEYIEARRADLKEQELELVNKRSEIEKEYSKVVLDEYAKRKAFKQAYEEFFDSISFKLYNMATKDKVDAATLYSLFKTELDNMGITSVDKVSAWLFDMSQTVKDFQTEEADFKQTTHIKEGKKNINYKNAEKRLDKAYEDVDEIVARLENYKTYIPQSNDDVDEQTRINIGKAYAAKILSRLNSSIKSTYKKVFKKARVEELEQVHINTIRKSVKEANEKIDQDIEKLIKTFKKHGIIPNINKGVQSIDTLIAKLDPETDKGTIAQLKGLQARVKNALYKKQHNQDILDALDNAKVISIEDVLIKSAKDVFKKNEITTKPKDIIDMVAYLAGSGTKELNKEAREAYKAQQESIKDYDDAVAERDKINRYLYVLPEEIETLTATLELRKATLDKLVERRKKAVAMLELDKEYTNTNIGTYKKLHNLDPRLNDVEVLDIIVKETESLVEGDLKAIIEDAGDYEPHNPVVDTLVTRLNYIAQLKKMGVPVPKEFIVLDMETVTNDMGHRVPYQMTMIKEENGKIKIVNTYINNRIFHTEDGTDMSPELAGFYKQQETILKKNNPNITDDEIKAKTDALIERIKGLPNTVEFIHTFVTELNGASDVPIVAHNGSRFDFPNYDLFLENYARRLLTNLYYQQIKNNDPEKIRARLEESTIGILDKEGFDDTLILEYQNVINKTLGKIERNEPVTIDEQKQLDKLNDAILIIRTYNSIERAELANNIIVNAELKESLLTGDYSEANKIKALVQKYVTSTDDAVRKQIYNDLVGYYTAGYALHETMEQGKEIEALVKEMLDRTELQFKELKEGIAEIDYAKVQGYKTVRKGILESNTKGRITTTSKAYRPGDNLKGHLNTIKQLEDHIKYLKGTGDNVVETIYNLNAKQIAVTEERTRLNSEYIKLKKELESSIANQEKAIGNIIEYARKIQDVTSNPVYNANKKIKAYVRDHSLYTDTLSNQASTGLLRLQQDEQIRLMRNKLDSLIHVRDYIINELIGKQDDSKLEEMLKRENIDMTILKISSEAERTKVIKDYKKQIKDLESLIETVDGETFFSEKLKTKTLERIQNIREASKKQVDELSTELLSRWNSDETRALLGKKFIDMELDDVYKNSSYKKYWKILENNKDLKDDIQFIELVNLLSDRSPLFRALDLFNSKDTRTLYESSEVQELIVEGIKKDIHTLQSKIATAASIKISKNKNDLAINLLNSAFNSFLTEVKTTDSLKDTIERTDVINILSGRGRKTTEMSEETLINEARRRLPIEVLEALEDEHVTRIYDNILKNDDKVALILDPEKAYSTRNIMDDGSEMITVSVYDEVHDTLQKMSFSSKYPQQVTFKLTYNYTTVGRDLIQHKPKEYPFSTIKSEEGDEMDLGFGAETVHTDVADLKKNLFKYTNKKGLRPGIKDSMIYKEDGRTDASKKAIENLLDLYLKYEKTFKTYKKGTMDDFNTHFKKFFEEVKNDQGLQLKDLKRINMTKVMEQRFKQYLDVVQYAKRGDDYNDVLKVYAGLSNKLLSKFNALVPGKVLNMIPSDYSNNFTLLYDDETLSDYNFDLVNSSEGSAGSSFMLRNYYTVDVPFRHSTNTVRTILSVPKLYAKFTSIKVINDLYKLEDADTSNKDFMDLIDDLDSDHKDILKELLVKEYNGKRINAFTPNITTDGMYDKFKNDSLHKNGVNIEVAFANDPRAFEDTILVDYDDAKALGWLEGNKTWLGLYGFKGAVKYIKGLRDVYGATFVAKADSINSRGAYGALLEMSLNTIRKYLIKDTNSISREALVALRKYDKKIKALFQVTDDGKMIVDQGKDYDKILRSIDSKLVDMLTRTTLRKKSTGTYYRASTNQIETFNVDKKILRGELYVTLDSEHTADHMAHTAEVDSHGGINYVMKDHKNSVRGGVVISPSVVYTMMAKGNVDWQKAFPADMTAVDLYANVMNFGLDYLIDNYKVEVNGVINPIKTVENIIEKTKASTLASSVNEYMFYKSKFENKLTTVEDKAYAEYRMAYLDQMIKQKSLDSMTGLHGAYYQSTYKKHPGIRQQLVANTDLGLGEVRISREGYKALIEMKQGWLQRNGKPLSDAEVKNITKKINDASLSDEDFAAYLNKQDIYAYVVAVRSPVQDYNAVPVIKVVGTTAHKATEANSYFYKMVGGDNDGDTIGMAAIDSEGYDALAPLDATKESYYDKEYVDADVRSVAKKLIKPSYKIVEAIKNKTKEEFINEVKTKYLVKGVKGVKGIDTDAVLDMIYDDYIVDSYFDTVERDYEYKDPKDIKAIDARYAYVGKKTFIKGVRDHYTWDELYLITYGDRINTILQGIDISDKKLEKKLVTPELKRIYMNVLIRKRTGGFDTNEDYTVNSYFDTDVVNKFYDDNRDEILRRIIFNHQVQEGEYNPSDLITREDVKYHSETLSKEDKAYLATMTINDFINSTAERSQEIKEKIMFNRFYNRIIYNTITRIQVSKRGVNIFGGNRKQQLVASVLSIFSKINSSPDGSIWHKLKLTTTNAKGDTIITVRSVAEGLIKSTYKIEEAVKNKTKEEFINEVKTKHLVKGIDDNSFDTDEVLGMIYDNYSKANKTQDVLSSLAKALRTKDAQELIKHFETHTIKDPLVDVLVKRLKKEVKVNPKVWINNVDIQWIKTLYFGRFDDEAKRYFDVVYSEKATSKYLNELSKQYIDQHIIDRGKLNALSDKATDIIGVAKHFGIDIDPVEYLKRYTAAVKALTTEASVRRVAIGEEEHALSMAIAMNKNTFDRSGIRFSDAEVKTKRDALKPGGEIKLAEDYRSSNKAYTDLERVIDDMARVEFFGDSYVTNSYYNDVKDAILEMFKIFNEERDLYRASTRLEATMFKDTKLTIPQLLLQYNVSGYRIERVLINALTTFKYINNNYHANTGGTLDIRKLSMLKDSLYFFEVLQYLHTHAESNKLKTNSDDIKYTARILLNINEVDPDLLAIDDEGNPIKIVSNDIDYNNLVYYKGMFQEAISNLSTATNIDTGTDSFKNLNKLEQKVLEEMIRDLRLVTSETPHTAGDLLDKIQSEFESAKLLYEHLEGKIKDSKYNRDNPEVSKTKVANKFSFSYFNIGNSVQGITDLHNNYKGVEKEILSKQKELEKIEADIRSLNNIEDVLNKQEKFFKGVRTKDDMIKRLERLKEEVLAKVEVINKQMSDYAFNLNFDKATILLHTEDGRNIYNLYDSKPKMLTQKDIQDLQDSNLMNMDKYQAPFLTIIELYAIKDNNGVTIDYDWDALFKWYKENRRFNRLTIVMKAFDDETLLKKLNDLITKVDKEWEELTVDEQKQYKSKKKYEKTRARYKRIRFDDPDKLNEYVKLLNDGEETQSIRFQGKTYQGVETGLDLTQHITPTLKEIDITKASDFKAVFDFIKSNGEYLIGFSDLNSVMSAMDQAYKPYRFTGRFADVIANLQHAQKLFMRYSMGFLFRNFIDTWNQLMSEMYYHKNAYGLIKEMFTPKGIVHYMGMTWNIYGAYEALSHERLTTLSLVNTKYVDIERLLDKDNLTTKDFEAIKENIEHIRNQLFNYVDTADNLTATELTNRVKNRSMRGKDLLSRIDNMLEYINAIPTDNINNIKVIKGRLELKQTVTFLLNMRFAEFFLMHNKMQPEHNKYKNKLNRISKRYQNKSEQDYEEFKHILFEINAFMQTNAQIDQYKSDEYRKLHRLVNEQKRLDTDSPIDLTYAEITKRLRQQEQTEYSKLERLLGRKIYEHLNESIENTGRIAGFLFDRYLNGYSFDETVNKSLKRFFNYGQRSSVEMQLIADIPYLSFPIRSIDNWINRLTNPSYIRLMSDIIDGIYAQYQDEDGQYDDFTKFQITNGWMPIMKGLGVRFGHGAFDVQNILSATGDVLDERQNPLLRGVATLIETQDAIEALKQLATVGVITRAANPLTAAPKEIRNTSPVLSIFSKKSKNSIANTFNFLFEHNDYKSGYGYKKYTPYRYRNNNGRYELYENIYKNWFNQYGRMRKPKVDPIGLVKDIRWQQYVRYRQSKSMLRR